MSVSQSGSEHPDDREVLASVRRILGQEAAREQATRPEPAEPEGAPPDEDVLQLEEAMMIETTAGEAGHSAENGTPSASAQPRFYAEETVDATRSALGSLRAALRDQKSTVQVHRGGPTIEDLIREELRPLLKEWLDSHLPSLVEKVVRTEIARIVERDGL